MLEGEQSWGEGNVAFNLGNADLRAPWGSIKTVVGSPNPELRVGAWLEVYICVSFDCGGYMTLCGWMASLMTRLRSEKRKHKELPLSSAHVDSGAGEAKPVQQEEDRGRGGRQKAKDLGSL